MEKEKNGRTVTRRNFLKAAGATAAVAGLATGGMTLAPWTAEAAALPKKWDETYDVVIIGSGFAGLAAAYEAKKAEHPLSFWKKCAPPVEIQSLTAVLFRRQAHLFRKSRASKIHPTSFSMICWLRGST